jgi:hypothetical protein
MQFNRSYPKTVSTTTLVNRDTGETCQFDVEHDHVHRKFAPGFGPGLYLPPTGFDLLFVLPVALCAAACEIAKGYELEFVYAEDGSVPEQRAPIKTAQQRRRMDFIDLSWAAGEPYFAS